MTSQILVRLKKFISSPAMLIAAVALFSMASPGSQAEVPADQVNASPSQSSAVGEISLVLGKAYLQRPGTRRQLIEVGATVHVSDQIVTEGNGHVHIRFVDQALVSVRPESRLEVVRYDFDPKKPEQSAVKFNLLEGITRTISGEAAKAARQRFRLNTPIAAIGVRGTDFVVSATEQSTRALVNEGVIVVAPYSADCSFDGLAPCSANGVELAENSLQAIELDSVDTLPRLLAIADTQDPEEMRAQLQQGISRDSEASVDKDSVEQDLYLEDTSSVSVADQVADDAAQVVESIVPISEPEPTVPVVETPALPQIVDLELDQRQLVWGRYASAPEGQYDIATNFTDVGDGREVTVGNLEYGLFRTENGSKRIDSGLTVVSFSLAHGRATYSTEAGSSAMDVDGGTLDIDFQQNLFATELNLNHSATGQIDFTASGRIYDGGYFHSRNDDQRIAGAVSIDGQEAGYLFERQLEEGDISGLTLWDSQ
jgi:hypothetical protein